MLSFHLFQICCFIFNVTNISKQNLSQICFKFAILYSMWRAFQNKICHKFISDLLFFFSFNFIHNLNLYFENQLEWKQNSVLMIEIQCANLNSFKTFRSLHFQWFFRLTINYRRKIFQTNFDAWRIISFSYVDVHEKFNSYFKICCLTELWIEKNELKEF